MGTRAIPEFSVVPGLVVHEILAGCEVQLIDLVEQAYLLHGASMTTNPASLFLRFPDNPDARMIALPAAVRGSVRADGLKWISSFPENIREGIPRASAVVILNDPETGYPFACLEGSIISATRTAASAAVAVRHLSRGRALGRGVGLFGAGLIARYVCQYLDALRVPIRDVGIYDAVPEHAEALAGHLGGGALAASVQTHKSAEDLIRSHDIVVFATTAARPHVSEPAWLAHHPLVLHISLRDLAPDLILSSTNVVDDVDHVLKAGTSLHLAEQQTGQHGFIAATLPEVIISQFEPKPDETVIFSPFGLGVLDIVVAEFVCRRAAQAGRLVPVADFFYDTDRHRGPAGEQRDRRG